MARGADGVKAVDVERMSLLVIKASVMAAFLTMEAAMISKSRFSM